MVELPAAEQLAGVLVIVGVAAGVSVVLMVAALLIKPAASVTVYVIAVGLPKKPACAVKVTFPLAVFNAQAPSPGTVKPV